MRKIALVLFCGLLAGGVGAVDGQGASRFDEYDQNGDGQITPMEFETRSSRFEGRESSWMRTLRRSTGCRPKSLTRL